jgi:tetratricopeptide (TPR) repeat protein
MEWLAEAAARLRGLLAQPWLELLQPALARTPDWAVVAVGPAILALLSLVLWLVKPRRLKTQSVRHDPESDNTLIQQAVPKRVDEAALPAVVNQQLEEPPPEPTPQAEDIDGATPLKVSSLTGPRVCGIPGEGEQDRKARVFLSSTFRDMATERRILATDVFPALKREFRTRGVEVQEVDLRWGVNEGDVTLDLCLGAVRRSNWFVGLIGQRYGTRLEDTDVVAQLKKTYPIVEDGLGRSLTELEILEALDTGAEQPKQIVFFERDPAWLDTLSDGERPNFEEAGSDAQKRLTDLKQRIVKRVGHIERYGSPREIGEVFEKTIRQALEQTFPPIDDPDDPFMQEHRLHSAYGRERFGTHVGQDAYLDGLSAWMGEEARTAILIVGASGGGKSTLVANWTRSWAQNHKNDLVFVHYLGASPDSAKPAAILRRLWLFLDRVSGQEGEAPGIDEDLNDVRDRMSARLRTANAVAAREGVQILIALDGLDKLQEEHQNLGWWPRVLPGRIRLLASSLTGQARDSAEVRGWRRLEVKPFGEKDQAAFISQTLEKWSKQDLTAERKARVLDHPLAGLPLFLKAMLEELRVSAGNDVLDARLDDYLHCTAMPDLYARILVQVDAECGRDFVAQALSLVWAGRSGIEEDAIVAITSKALGLEAGQAGLSWERLRNRLSEALRDNQGRITFAHDYLRQGAEQAYLKDNDAKCASHLAMAIHFDYPKPDLRQAEELPYQLRAAGRLGNDDAWSKLETLLTDLDRFRILRARGDGELVSYWAPLRERKHNIEALLCEAFKNRFGAPETWPRETAILTWGIDDLLEHIGSTGSDRRDLLANTVRAFECLAKDNPDILAAQRDLSASYTRIGQIYCSQGNLAVGLEAYKRSLSIDERLAEADPNNVTLQLDLSESHGKMGDVLFEQGNLAGALMNYQVAMAIDQHLVTIEPDDASLQNALSLSRQNIGDILVAQGNLAGALDHYRACLDISERLADAEPNNALSYNRTLLHAKIGDVLVKQGNLAEALECYEADLRISKRLTEIDPHDASWQHSLALSYENIGDVHRAKGDLAGALDSYRADLAIARRLTEADPDNTLWQRELTVPLEKIGDVLKDQGNLAGAFDSYTAAMAVAQRLAKTDSDNARWKRDLSTSHEKIGDLLADRGNLAGALDSYQASMGIRKRLVEVHSDNTGWQSDLSVSYINIGDILVAQGNLSESLDSYKASLAIRQRLTNVDPNNTAWHRNLCVTYTRIGDVLIDQGSLADALDSYSMGMTIAGRLSEADPDNVAWQRDLSISHEKIGDAHRAEGNISGALDSLELSLAIRIRLTTNDPDNTLWQRDVSVSYEKIGMALLEQGQLPSALANFKESMAIAQCLAETDLENTTWQRDLSRCHEKIAYVLFEQGDLTRALDNYKVSMAITMRLLEADPDNAGCHHELSAWHIKIGDVLKAQGNLSEALNSYQAGMAIRERLVATHPDNLSWQRDLSVSHERIGRVLEAEGELAEALNNYRVALSIAHRLAEAAPENSSSQNDLALSYIEIGNVLKAQGNLTDALDSYRASLGIRERLSHASPDNPSWKRELSVSHEKIGDVLKAKGNCSTALKSYQASLSIRELLGQTYPGNSDWQRDISVSHEKIGIVYEIQGHLVRALDSYRADLAIAKRLADTDPTNTGWQRDLSVSYDNIGDVLQAQSNLAGAFDSFLASLSIRKRLADSDPANAAWQKDLSLMHKKIGDVLEGQGNVAEALNHYQAGMTIRERLAEDDPDNTGLQRDVCMDMLDLQRFPESGVTWAVIALRMDYLYAAGRLARSDVKYLRKARAKASGGFFGLFKGSKHN